MDAHVLQTHQAASHGSSPRKRGEFAAKLLPVVSFCYNFLRLRHLPSHRNTVKSANQGLATIRSFSGANVGERAFSHLRKIDPNAFEEMVLTALQSGGRLVRRNLRYSGDYGEDGRFYEPGTGWMLVQCKRYAAHISAEHVRDFHRLVRSTGCAGGVFVHTGKTGLASKIMTSGEWSRVVMVSGHELLGLLMRGELP